MKQIMTVFRFTFLDAVRKKAFVISTIIICAVVLLLSLAPRVIGLFAGESTDSSAADEVQEDRSATCYVINETPYLQGAADALTQAASETLFLEGSMDEMEEYQNMMKDDVDLSVILIEERDAKPFVTIYSKDFMSGVSSSSVMEVLDTVYTSEQLTARGMTQEEAMQALAPLSYEETMVGEMDISGYVLGIVITMVLFFAIYYYGYGVAMSVATEKASRVMETLVVSAKPSRILLGKALAMGALGFVQLAGILLFGGICYKVFVPADFLLNGVAISLDSFTVPVMLSVIAYFLLGYCLYAMMDAACGASVSKMEDVNSAMMPVMMLTIISFYLGYFSIIGTSENGALQTFALYFPFSSPFIVPSRLLQGAMEPSQVVISLIILAVSVVVVAIIGMRIYSASVYQYGKRQKVTQLFKMGKDVD